MFHHALLALYCATIMELAAGTKLGPYEVVGPIGAGGMGEVYRARDTRLDRCVALKILPAHFSCSPEQKAASTAKHVRFPPSLIRTFAFSTTSARSPAPTFW